MTRLDCDQTRSLLPDYREGVLSPAECARIERHLGECAECRRFAEEEAVLSELLRKLPARPAPEALKRRLAAQMRGEATASAARNDAARNDAGAAQPAKARPATAQPTTTTAGERLRRRVTSRAALIAAALSALALLLSVALVVRALYSPVLGDSALVREAVNDHVRVLVAQRPLEVVSGGIHQVKPWFAGRLDFAPATAFGGDERFELTGGAIGYFIDRKAATMVWKHEGHTISLFVFRAEGLSWPLGGTPLGRMRAHSARSGGFNLLLFRDADLGYALVSDIDADALRELGRRIAG